MAEGKVKSVVRLSAAKLLMYGGTGLAGILIARLLGPSDYGVVAVVLSITGILGVVSDFNLSAAAVKFGSEAGAKKDDFVTTAFFSRIVIGLLGLIAFVAAAKPIAERYGFPPGFLTLVAFGYLLQSPLALRAMWSIERRFRLMAFVEGAQGVVYFVVMIVFAYLFRLAGVFYAIVAISAFIGVSSLLKSRLGRFDISCLKRMLPFSFYAMLLGLFTYVTQNYDKVLLGLYLTKEQLGHYALAYKSAYFLMFVPLAVQAVVFPAFSELSSRKNHPEMRRLLTRTMKTNFTYALAGSLALITIFHFLVKAFLTRYAASEPLLPFLLVPFVLETGIGSVCSVMLAGANRMKEVAYISFVQAGIAVALASQLARTYGVWGVIASLWVAYLASSLLYLWRARAALRH